MQSVAAGARMQSVADLPLVAMADSGPFFDTTHTPLRGLLARLAVPPARLTAAYLGTANGDVDDYFELAQAAMQGLGIRAVHFIRTLHGLAGADLELLCTADVVVLSGGDPVAAMAVWEPTGIADVLRQRAAQVPRTCLMIGVSAGAMQMASWVWDGDRSAGSSATPQLVAGLGIAMRLPAMAMHEEKAGWREAKTVAERVGVVVGVPFGGIALLERDGGIQALRRPLTLMTRGGGSGSARTVQPGERWEPEQLELGPEPAACSSQGPAALSGVGACIDQR
jgi:hypothetical protein